jgi:hypothetical protein
MYDPDSEIDREPPAFWVGAAGFSREQRAVIEASLHAASGLGADWRLCDIGEEADAWFVNGAKCCVLPDGELRISAGFPKEAALSLDMRAVDRPVAFATPISDADLEPHYIFDASSSASVRQVLAQFDSCLVFARAQFVLGAEVVERGATLRHGIFHVRDRGKLLAILDFRHGEVALCPQLDPAEVPQATWSKRPNGALAPPDFVRMRPAQLAWNYVRRSDGNLLPPRYRTRTIYYRRSPRVPVSWLRDSHLKILKELSCESASFFELGERTGFTPPQLERDVASLFYAGAITTTASKAAAPAAAKAYPKSPVLTEHASAYAYERADPTVPGALTNRARG